LIQQVAIEVLGSSVRAVPYDLCIEDVSLHAVGCATLESCCTALATTTPGEGGNGQIGLVGPVGGDAGAGILTAADGGSLQAQCGGERKADASEADCAKIVATYNYANAIACPGPVCQQLLTCCAALTGSAAGVCMSDLITAGGQETVCAQDMATFNATAPAACPIGPNCEQLQSCCAGLTGDLATECQDDLFNAAGAESTCASDLLTYHAQNAEACLGPYCQQLQTCCSSLTGDNATECLSDFASAAGDEPTCFLATPTYNSANATACPLRPYCQQLQTCCAAITGDDETACLADLALASGDETSCSSTIPTYNTDNPAACPIGPNCQQLQTCCASITGDDAASCLSELQGSGWDESSCSSYTPTYNADNPTACPLGPNCQKLQACCATPDSADSDDCSSYEALGGGTAESWCSEVLSNIYAAGPPACLGPICTALYTCCNAVTGTDDTECLDLLTAAAGDETSCMSYFSFCE
jgi:hypothetical protein